jgi:hypothetical protein
VEIESPYWEKWGEYVKQKLGDKEIVRISPNPRFWGEILVVYKENGKEYVTSIKESK